MSRDQEVQTSAWCFHMVLRRVVGAPPLGHDHWERTEWNSSTTEHLVKRTVLGIGDWQGTGSFVSHNASFPKLAWSRWARYQGLYVLDVVEARTSGGGQLGECIGGG